MTSRRIFIASTAAGVWLNHSLRPLQAWPGESRRNSLSEVSGCRLIAGELDLVSNAVVANFSRGEQMSETSGDASLDRALGKALVRISQAMSVRPAFGFFDDGTAPNAYASPDTQVDGTWGVVVFGRALFHDQITRYKDSGTSILAIVAHEFGHILQYTNGLDRRLLAGQQTVKRIELQADMLSGWYLGVRKRSDASISLWSSGDTFNRIGDNNYMDRNHHGTPQERVAAAENGFRLGYDEKRALDYVLDASTEYVMQY